MVKMRLACMAALVACLGVGPANALDLQQEEQAVREAEASLSKALSAHDREGVAALLAKDVVSYSGEGARLGREAFLENWKSLLEEGGPTLSWQPATVHVYPTGELAYSTGPYQVKGKDKDGNPREAHGEFLTVWIKQQDGSWKVGMDTGTSATPQNKQ